MRNPRRVSYAITLIVALTLSGCVSSDRYPEDWPARVIGDAECPDLSGVYENSGLGSGDILFCRGCPDSGDYRQCAEKCTDPTVQLSEIFFDIVLASKRKVHIVAANGSSIEIRIDDQDAGGNDRPLQGSRSDFECSDGKLRLILDRGLEVDLGGMAYATKRLDLVRAIDGSLIGEFRYTGKGVIFVAVPAGWSETHFIRWPTVLE